MKKASLFVVILILLVGSCLAKNYRVIHHFDNTKGDGAFPYGTLIESDSVLYGTTSSGGDNGKGTIFKIKPDGTDYQNIYSFQGGKLNSSQPCGSLLKIGSAFYGMTRNGGTIDSGTVFKINKDGSGFELLHSFTGACIDGRNPEASLINSGNTLYGITMFGGIKDSGTVFKINIDGSGYEVIHSFDQNKNEGVSPMFPLIISGSVLYGTTIWGGRAGELIYAGTIYKLNTDGSNFGNLHVYDYPDISPSGALVISNSVLYGNTCCGGIPGTIFQLNPNGMDYTNLHEFSFFNKLGISPHSTLILSGDYLYGTTWRGGTNDSGLIFRVNINDTNYSVLYNFLGSNTDGSRPNYNDLFKYKSYLYGMTQKGGSKDQGIIFRYTDSVLADTCGFYSFDYTNFDNTSDLAFNGTATTLDSNLRICKRLNNVAGSVFYKRPMPVACNFYTNFTFRFSEGFNDYDDGSPAGADGIAFIIQATDTKNIGKSGGGLGYSGISNSIAVEFDSYNNGIDFNENTGSHLAVMSNGKKPNISKHNVKSQLGFTTDIPRLRADSTLYHCRIEYNYNQKRMKIWLDTTGNFRQSALEVDSLDLTSLIKLINMNKAYIGFTSSTGTSVENTDLLSWSFCYNQVQPITEVEDLMIEIQNGMIMSPNPVTDFIEISYPPLERGSGGVDIKIYNLLGEILTTPSLRDTPPWKGGEKVRIDVSGLAPGMYFVRIADKVGKFVKL